MSETETATARAPALASPRSGPAAMSPAPSTTAAEDPQTYLVFDLAGQIFAADVQYVREILDHQPITRLPNASPDLLGMIDVRGEGVAVIDLTGRLSLAHRQADPEGRIVVFMLGREGGAPIGVLAEQVRGVTEIGADEIEAAPDTMTGWDGSVVRGIARVGGALTMVLEMERLFGSETCDPFDFS
ncbi:MAG: chemotaxis protein CheW [Pararhodobacter sp.]|nr:chemotaxis protein CheW [Pararhodobacter sp.]